MRFLLLCFLVLLPLNKLSATAPKQYVKHFYSNGVLKAAGWQTAQGKSGYWFFYHPNGELKSKGHFLKNKKQDYWYFYNNRGDLVKEGHFNQNKAQDWWIFYEIGTPNKRKIQYQNDQMNGFCLNYVKNSLQKVEKYTAGKKIDEWTSISAFRRDNPGIPLR